MKQTKKIFFATLGCRLNQAETEELRIKASSRGFDIADNEESADILVLNSCSVTDRAQRDIDKLLARWNKLYPIKETIITGCGVKEEHEKYGKVVANKNKQRILEFLSFQARPGIDTDKDWILNLARNDKTVDKEQKYYSEKTRLMFKVQDGCDNFCSYCIVPYLRGREQSKDLYSIINELKKAEKRGFKEVVLCGVNIGKYSHQGKKLADLIQEILKNTFISRIRLSSINPDDFSDDLIALWAREGRLCNHFHISLQSGSDKVLGCMGRKYNTRQYADLAARIRKDIKDVQITTDVIVGFPGETEEQFTETVQFIKKMKFLKVHVFRYSKREGTKAAKMNSKISEKIKKERADKLRKIESDIRRDIIKKHIAKEMDVLFESPSSSFSQRRESQYSGFTMNYIRVFKKSKKNLTNEIVKVKIVSAEKDKLLAK